MFFFFFFGIAIKTLDTYIGENECYLHYKGIFETMYVESIFLFIVLGNHFQVLWRHLVGSIFF